MLGMVRSISGRRVAGASGLALQLCAGAAFVIWPDRVWIAQAVFALGAVLFIGSVCLWFFTNYRLRWPAVALARNENTKNKIDDNEIKAFLRGKLSQQTAATSPPTIWAGLYVCDMRFNFDGLEKDRHSRLTVCVFNGTGSVLELSNILGKVKFKDRNNADPNRTGTLPTPTQQTDTARTVAPFQEWVLILNHWGVPATEADKLLEMLEADTLVDFDLRELKIEVFGQYDRNKVELLPIWDGVSYSRSRGFGKITHSFSMLRGDHFRDKDCSDPPVSAS